MSGLRPAGAPPGRAPSGAAVKVAGVGKTFETRGGGETVALEGIDLDVQPTEFVSLIGPSGCGKSTLLRIVGDLIEPTHGHRRGQRQARAPRPPRPRLRHGLPGAGAVRLALGGGQRPAAAGGHGRGQGHARAARPRDARAGRAGRVQEATTRTSCRAACSSASRSRGRSPSSRRCCSWTSPSARSTR